MKAIKGVLFDNDGTLIDTHDLILSSMRYATQNVLGEALPDEVLMAKVGQPLVVQMRDFSNDLSVQEELLRVYREHNHANHDNAISGFLGLKDCLQELMNRDLVMGVVTSKMHALAWRGLEIVGFAPYLSCCIGADDCQEYKPKPEPVIRGLDALGLNPDECLYVGDSPFDIQAGHDAGCKTVAVTWGMFSRSILEEQKPSYIIDSPEELVELFNG